MQPPQQMRYYYPNPTYPPPHGWGAFTGKGVHPNRGAHAVQTNPQPYGPYGGYGGYGENGYPPAPNFPPLQQTGRYDSDFLGSGN
jgi:hypothetical protein